MLPDDVPEGTVSCRVAITQPWIPHYRRPIFDLLAGRCDGLTILHGPIPADQGWHAGDPGTRFRSVLVTHRAYGPIVWMPAMWAAADPERFDVVVHSWNTRYVHILPALLRARRRGLATVAWGHGYSKHDNAIRRALRRRIGAAAHVVVTYSHMAARALVEEGLDRSNVFVAANALDQSGIQEARSAWLEKPDDLDTFKKAHGMSGVPVALFVARLATFQRLTALLDAWRQVQAALPEARLAVVGDGPARPEIERYCRSLGIDQSVSFHGAVYGEEKLAPFFLSATLFAVPHEVGLSLHHAFGYGLPAVAFDNPWHHNPEFEALLPGITGLVARENDTADLAAKLLTLLTDTRRAAHLGEAARKAVLTRFSATAMVDGFCRAIGRALQLAGRTVERRQG